MADPNSAVSTLINQVLTDPDLAHSDVFSLDPPIRLILGGSFGFECEHDVRAGSSVPVSHRSLPQMFPKVSSRPCGVVLEQERIGQDNTVLGGLNAACQSRAKSVAHGHFVGRCRISFLAR
ncbi:hypothetical protein BAURA63_03359 [Brevibacterium aurantiacum]|uniref:Uncharacterized protein n=1 Tax=Brevibacterium aurantiacum TaxID=273384 RepID=A0A2H1KJP7_BREAU|nr:hypothetical protein BAURA63_03359 [Brevibacterium aurantiacum]